MQLLADENMDSRGAKVIRKNKVNLFDHSLFISFFISFFLLCLSLHSFPPFFLTSKIC